MGDGGDSNIVGVAMKFDPYHGGTEPPTTSFFCNSDPELAEGEESISYRKPTAATPQGHEWLYGSLAPLRDFRKKQLRSPAVDFSKTAALLGRRRLFCDQLRRG